MELLGNERASNCAGDVSRLELELVRGSALDNRSVCTRGADAILPRSLRMIESAIGALDEISRGYTWRRYRDTDARRHAQSHQVRFVALIRLHPLPNPFRDRACTLRRATGHHHRELLAAESCAHVED